MESMSSSGCNLLGLKNSNNLVVLILLAYLFFPPTLVAI